MVDSIISNLALLAGELPAVEDPSGSWSRGDLRRAVQSVHAYLARSRVGVGDRVAVVTADDKRIVAALLGARAAGAMVCPLDPTTAASQIDRIRPRLVVVTERVPGLDAVEVATLLEERGPAPASPQNAEHAWGVSTSGSSGAPKTVILTERSVAHVTDAIQELVHYTPQDRVHGGLPLFHTYGLSQLWLTMASGACLYLPGCLPTQTGMRRWLGGTTVLPTIASKLRYLYELDARVDARLITLAGQGADPDTRQLLQSSGASSRFVYFYGLTEATTRVLSLGHEEFFQRPRVTGRPIRGVRASVDADGELWVEGPNVAAGYLDDPTATAYRFPGGRLRTGDYFETDGDVFTYVGRLDGVFKRFGEKVVPELIEAALQSHSGVQRCLVTPEAGPAGEAMPIAWVVTREGGPLDAPALLRHMRSRLPAVMVPTEVRFVSSLPTTPGGKLVRQAPEPSVTVLTDPTPLASARETEIDAWLRNALGERLTVSPSAIEPTRPLAEYGLDSVGTVSLVAELRQWLGRSISYSVLWAYPTLAALSEHLANPTSPGPGGTREQRLEAQPWVTPTRSRSPNAETRVSELERRRLQLSLAAPHADGRSVWLAGDADGDFRLDTFAAAVDQLVMRHDVLRSKYSFSDGRSSKVILARLPIEVRVHDLTQLPEAKRRRDGLAALTDEVAAVFDLATAPLLKAAVVKLSERRHLFLVAFDHVIADAASVGLAWAELQAIYNALASKCELPPPPLLQYGDFTDWHEQVLAGPHATTLRDHCREHLSGSPSAMRRAGTAPSEVEESKRREVPRAAFPCHSAFVDIPQSLAAEIRGTAMRHGCTQFVLYYAAFTLLLAKWSGESDIAISNSYDLRGRELQLGEVIGMLTNTCALRTNLRGVTTLADLLERARVEVSRMIATSDLPSTLYPELPEVEDAFQVLFNYVEVNARRQGSSQWEGFTVRPLGRAALSMQADCRRNYHDLLFVLRNSGGRLAGSFLANAERWSITDAQKMASEYREILRGLTAPSPVLADLNAIPAVDVTRG